MSFLNGFKVLLCLVFTTECLYAEVSIPRKRQIHAVVVDYVAAPQADPLRMPTDVTVDSKGQVYVADGTNDRVVRFDSEGNVDMVVALAAENTLDQPVGITVDTNDLLWVADTAGHRIVIFGVDGDLLREIKLPLLDADLMPDPTDLIVTSDGRRCYIIDNDNHRILQRDNLTGQWKTMGQKGRSLGQFEYPFMICIGTEDYIYISEAMGARLHRISPQDEWSGIMGSWGVELGKLYRPKGIAADADGLIYVSDSTLQVIQVFDPWGRIKGVLCGPNGQPLQFQHPMGMCFDNQQRLLVTELDANRIAIVELNAVSIKRN